MSLKKKNQGFTLIELAIVVVIIGLFVGVIAQSLKVYIVSKQNDQLEKTVGDVEKAFADYRNVQGRYPCPAPRSGADMGVPGDCGDTSIAVGDCIDGVCIAQGANGRRVRIGGIPFGDENLNLTLADTVDPFDNQLTYAVTEHLATDSYAINEGDIEVDIIDLQGNITTKSGNEFTFFSHGRDGAGAYTAYGVPYAETCSTVGVDAENCDNDAVFATSLATSDVSGSAHFDDAVIHDLQFAPINLTCGANEVITNVSNGVPTCTPFSDLLVQHLSQVQSQCSGDTFSKGFGSSAQIICDTPETSSGTSNDGTAALECTSSADCFSYCKTQNMVGSNYWNACNMGKCSCGTVSTAGEN